MKTFLFFIAISSFFASLAQAEMKWVGSGSIDTRPSMGGHIGIQQPIDTQPSYGGHIGIGSPIDTRPSYGGRIEIQPSPYPIQIHEPIYERPRYSRCERRLEITTTDGFEIRRYRNDCRRPYRHWADEPVRYEIHEDLPPAREIEVEFPDRYGPRSEVEINVDAPVIREMIGNILGVNFSARWN